MGRMRQAVMAILLVVSLLCSSGCAALLLLGVGGAGGYLIKKGEGKDRKSSSSIEEVDRKHASNTKGESGRQLALETGGTSR